MIGLGFLACRRHHAALVDFVDHRERGPRTPAALAHLDRCARCRADLEATALMIMALRRLGDEVARAAVPTAPPRAVRPAVRRRQPPVAVSGAMLATAFAGLLAIPTFAMREPVGPASDGGSPVTSHSHQVSAELLPSTGVGSARFWDYGTFGLTSDVLWPPSGPSVLPTDSEAARFDILATSRRPGTWSATGDDGGQGSTTTGADAGVRRPGADSI